MLRGARSRRVGKKKPGALRLSRRTGETPAQGAPGEGRPGSPKRDLTAEREGFGHDSEDFRRIHEAADRFGIGAAGRDDEVVDRVHALAFAAREVAFDEVSAGLVLVGFVGDVLSYKENSDGIVKVSVEAFSFFTAGVKVLSGWGR